MSENALRLRFSRARQGLPAETSVTLHNVPVTRTGIRPGDPDQRRSYTCSLQVAGALPLTSPPPPLRCRCLS